MIDREAYDFYVDACNSRCWICARVAKLRIDRDERTNAIRGLLCRECDRLLGVSVDPRWHDRAAEYLRVAARAFGDTCRAYEIDPASTCSLRSSSVLIKTGLYLHSCCGYSWRVAYNTNDWPAAWLLGANPVPPRRAELADPKTIGHPGEEICSTCDPKIRHT